MCYLNLSILCNVYYQRLVIVVSHIVGVLSRYRPVFSVTGVDEIPEFSRKTRVDCGNWADVRPITSFMWRCSCVVTSGGSDNKAHRKIVPRNLRSRYGFGPLYEVFAESVLGPPDSVHFTSCFQSRSVPPPGKALGRSGRSGGSATLQKMGPYVGRLRDLFGSSVLCSFNSSKLPQP